MSKPQSKPLNHKAIDIPMVPPCPSCGRTRIHWDREKKICTCLWEECKKQWSFFPANEPSIADLHESIGHLELTRRYYSLLKGEEYFQAEKQFRLDQVSKLLREIEQLAEKRNGADSTIAWCNKNISDQKGKITEISTRTRATTELTWHDASPSRKGSAQGPKKATKKLAQSTYDILKGSGCTDEDIFKSMSLIWGQDELVLV